MRSGGEPCGNYTVTGKRLAESQKEACYFFHPVYRNYWTVVLLDDISILKRKRKNWDIMQKEIKMVSMGRTHASFDTSLRLLKNIKVIFNEADRQLETSALTARPRYLIGLSLMRTVLFRSMKLFCSNSEKVHRVNYYWRARKRCP